jgi:NADPH:quinone reductase
LAKLHGARVIATVSSDHKAQIALAAGADATVNYRTQDTVQHLRDLTGGEGVDHIVEVDFAGNFAVSREVLRDNGVLALYSAGVAPQPQVPLQFRASNVTVRFVLVYDMPEPAKEAAVQEITRLLEAGKLRHHPGPHFPFESAREAHQAVEGGAIGKVVLEVAESV